MPSSLVLARPVPNVIARRLGSSAVLVHLATNRIYELNETGIFVWECLTRDDSAETIVSKLTLAFDVDGPTAASELNRLVATLVDQGLATWAA